MTDDLKPLRDRLIQDCEGYDANDAIRAIELFDGGRA
jgi:hypothetical protein